MDRFRSKESGNEVQTSTEKMSKKNTSKEEDGMEVLDRVRDRLEGRTMDRIKTIGSFTLVDRKRHMFAANRTMRTLDRE